MLKTYICLLLLILVSSLSLHASMYPPDYPISSAREELKNGPLFVEKRIINLYTRNSILTVGYYGSLLNQYGVDALTLNIKLNGVHRSFKMTQAPLQMGGFAIAELHSGVYNCRMERNAWNCSYPSQEEMDLFYWAINDRGQDNAWDLEIWIEANGVFDSNNGRNYTFRMKPLK